MPETVFITDVSVAVAVRASISLPGVFVPKRLKGRSLVDGGIKTIYHWIYCKNKGQIR